MNKIIIALTLCLVVLTGCEEPTPYNKVSGEIVKKEVFHGKGGASRYLEISYPVGENNKFQIDSYYIKEEKEFNKYKVKEKVTIYVNNEGIGGVVKENK